MTERRVCRLANQPRGTQRYHAIQREDEDALTQAIILLASQYGRYGYRPNHGVAEAGRLAGRQGSRGAYLASLGAEGTAVPEATRTSLGLLSPLRAESVTSWLCGK